MRRAEVKRETKETRIELVLELDGTGQAEVSTGVGFLDHMLTHIARHGCMDLTVKARGDVEVDDHHTVEDIGICLGKALYDALGDRAGLNRFGHAVVPMDETLAEAAIDLSNRPYFALDGTIPRDRVGAFDSELVEEFFRAFAMNGRTTLHLVLRSGTNTHHCIEGLFKAFARALGDAVRLDPRVKGVPSTKGTLRA